MSCPDRRPWILDKVLELFFESFRPNKGMTTLVKSYSRTNTNTHSHLHTQVSNKELQIFFSEGENVSGHTLLLKSPKHTEEMA